MHLSRHAQSRSQQRRVTAAAIDLALSEGEVVKTWGGGVIYRLSDRALRGKGAAADRVRGVSVVAVDDEIVTVWKKRGRRPGQGRRLREAARLRDADDASRSRGGPRAA